MRPNRGDGAETQLENVSKEFTQAWLDVDQGAAEPSLDQFLSQQPETLRARILERLVAIDLQQRARRGSLAIIDSYLEGFPQFWNADNVSVDLICCEYRARCQAGQTVDPESYRERFPLQYDDFQARISTDTLHPSWDNPDPDLEPAAQDDGPGMDEGKDTRATLVPAIDETTPDLLGSMDSVPPFIDVANPASGASGDDNALRVVRTRDGYELIERIGAGQFGEVWLGKAPGGVDVAIKIIRFPIGHKITQLELQSLEHVKRIRHSFLLQVQAYWVTADQLYIVMELGDQTLHDIAETAASQETSIPKTDLLRYFREAAEAIDFLHAQKILHRDIKPANIILLGGHVKVADFGISRVIGQDNLSVTATTAGTPLYMAPEVWKGRMSPQSDQYSLAMAYAELRMGRAPYASQSFAEVMHAHLTSVPDLRTLDQTERRVVAKALAKSPKDRFDTCTEFMSAVERSLAAPAPGAASTGWASPRLMATALGATTLVLCLISAFLFRDWFFPEPPTLQLPDHISVRVGQRSTFTASLTAASDDVDAIHVTEVEGVSLRGTPAGLGTLQFEIAAHIDALPADYTTDVSCTVDGYTVASPFRFNVAPPTTPTQTHSNWQADSESGYTLVGDNIYDNRILCDVGGERVAFRLIPRRSSDDPATFYMMENKVWNSLFQKFVDQLSEKDREAWMSNSWQDGVLAGLTPLTANDHPRLPVFKVHFDDAVKFARWMGGKLPTLRQWSKACGYHEQGHHGAPTNLPVAQLTPKLVAYDRISDGPMPVGEAAADVSLFFCRDMAGNGSEWVRVPDNPHVVATMGAGYQDPAPFTFDTEEAVTGIRAYDKLPDASVSFRVVLFP